MGPRQPEYTVLARRWSNRWDVFVLDPTEGLIGSTTAATRGEVEHAARIWLGLYLNRPGPAHDVHLEVVYK